MHALPYTILLILLYRRRLPYLYHIISYRFISFLYLPPCLSYYRLAWRMSFLSYYGCGQFVCPLDIAYPKSLGHVTNLSKKRFVDLIQSQQPSNGCNNTHTILVAIAIGYTTTIKIINQQMELQILFRAIIYIHLFYSIYFNDALLLMHSWCCIRKKGCVFTICWDCFIVWDGRTSSVQRLFRTPYRLKICEICKEDEPSILWVDLNTVC